MRSAPVVVTMLAVVLGVACAPDPDSTQSSAQRLAAAAGCAACHGVGGEGATGGPPYIGLFGSQVPLVDGTSVLADDAYLVAAIQQPDAQVRVGYPDPMPANSLDADQVRAIVDYIKTLADGPQP